MWRFVSEDESREHMRILTENDETSFNFWHHDSSNMLNILNYNHFTSMLNINALITSPDITQLYANNDQL